MLKKLHYKLAHLILKYGKSTPKPNGHGSMVEFKMSNHWRFILDDYSYGIHLYVPKVDNDNIFREKEYDTFIYNLGKMDLTYSIVKLVPFTHTIEPEVNPSEKAICFGSVSMSKTAMLTNWNPGSYLNENFDFRVWSKPEPTELPNPNSGIDTVRFDEKTYLIYNPDESRRAPLVLAQVSDEHEVIDQITIRDGIEEGDPTNTRELSYPYMIENDGILHLVYTYGRSNIEYVKIQI